MVEKYFNKKALQTINPDEIFVKDVILSSSINLIINDNGVNKSIWN